MKAVATVEQKGRLYRIELPTLTEARALVRGPHQRGNVIAIDSANGFELYGPCGHDVPSSRALRARRVS